MYAYACTRSCDQLLRVWKHLKPLNWNDRLWSHRSLQASMSVWSPLRSVLTYPILQFHLVKKRVRVNVNWLTWDALGALQEGVASAHHFFMKTNKKAKRKKKKERRRFCLDYFSIVQHIFLSPIYVNHRNMINYSPTFETILCLYFTRVLLISNIWTRCKADFKELLMNLIGPWMSTVYLSCHYRERCYWKTMLLVISIPNTGLLGRLMCHGEDDYHTVLFKSRGNKWGPSWDTQQL